MNNFLILLSKQLLYVVEENYPSLKPATKHIAITPSKQDAHGHYQCNSAMRLAKLLHQAPLSIANQLATTLREQNSAQGAMLSKIEVAGPGFINMTINPRYLEKQADNMLKSPHLGVVKPSQKQRIIIDYSSPNVAKEMHVGHLRSTVIGDCIANLLTFLGHEVLRINHIGDWGTAFGMLIAYLKTHAPEVIKGKQTTDLHHLAQWYKQAKNQFDNDSAFKRRAQQEVVALQSHDEQSLAVWRMICDISKQAHQVIYEILNIKLTDVGESFYNPMLPELITDLRRKNLLVESDGAQCLFLAGFVNKEGKALPMILQKSDGGYNYSTTDMAAIRYRIEKEKADRIIYVTDSGQSTHFSMIFSAARKAGYWHPEHVRVDHVPFGLVLGNDGKKFKTRSGETEKLMDLLTTAVARAQAILEERQVDLDDDERQQLASILGINAVKYADLSCNRTSDYQFNYEKMLRFEGNTAAFLMYAYVRIAGIKRKVGIDTVRLEGDIKLAHTAEIALALHACQFIEILDSVADDLFPNRLCDYLYNLAEKFNVFFRDCRVQGSKEQQARLLLCELVAKVLKQGLEILGLKVIDRM